MFSNTSSHLNLTILLRKSANITFTKEEAEIQKLGNLPKISQPDRPRTDATTSHPVISLYQNPLAEYCRARHPVLPGHEITVTHKKVLEHAQCLSIDCLCIRIYTICILSSISYKHF